MWTPGRAIRRILMIKAHSAGIGDILRSSAAWRTLQDHHPEAELHLVLLTKEPGYASEAFMARHHLLASFKAVDKRSKGWRGWRAFYQEVHDFAKRVKPDLVIDFEPHGLRTSLLTLAIGRQCQALTVGVAQVPGRGLFYHRSAPSFRSFARARGLPEPLEITNRDYVALSALGLERNQTPIELRETAEGKEFHRHLRDRCQIAGNAPIVGVNIGCGTPGAGDRRPDLELLSGVIAYLQREQAYQVILTGGAFEAGTNAAFRKCHEARSRPPVIDLAGQTSLLELSGLIKACDLFISADSGPYHMAVALRVPTVVVFNRPERVACHNHPWVRDVIAPDLSRLPLLIAALKSLAAENPKLPWLRIA